MDRIQFFRFYFILCPIHSYSNYQNYYMLSFLFWKKESTEYIRKLSKTGTNKNNSGAGQNGQNFTQVILYVLSLEADTYLK